MILVSVLREKYLRIGKNCTKLPIIPLKRGSTLILNKSGRGSLKKHPHPICNKSIHGLNKDC